MSAQQSTRAVSARPLSERRLRHWVRRTKPADRVHERQKEAAIERWRQAHPECDPTRLVFDLDELEGAYGEMRYERALLIAGSVCTRNGYQELWSEIYRTALADLPLEEGEAFTFLEEATRAVRRGAW